MLKACRGAALATGLLSLPLVANADCPPVESIDRYAQTAGDALSALHELVPESQLRTLEDRYAAMVMLKWQWQGRAAVQSDAAAMAQLLSCYEQTRCGILASDQVTIELAAILEQSDIDPQLVEDLLPVEPSASAYAWARRTLECDRPAPPPISVEDLIVQETVEAPIETIEATTSEDLALPDQLLTPEPQVASFVPEASPESLQPQAAAVSVIEPEAPEETLADPPPIEMAENETPDANLTATAPEQLMLRATQLILAGKSRDAIAPLESACLVEAANTDHSPACETLFSVYSDADGASGSSRNGQAYFELSLRLCELEYGRGCENLSDHYATQNSPEAHQAAVTYAEQSCNLGNAEACATLSSFYLAGHASDPDPIAARAKLEQSCELGLLTSCQKVADFYMRGIGGDADIEIALRFVDASCPEGSSDRADLCVSAADYILINENASETRSARVRSFIRRACEIGHAVGCAWYAEDLELGIGGIVDLTAARQARVIACEFGDQKSCNSNS